MAALAALAGCAVAVSRAFRARRRARWQLAARTEPPGDPCKEGSRYCRKLTIAIEPGPRHVAYLQLTATDTVQHTLHRQLTGLLVDELNDALHEYRRGRETTEALRHSLVAPADRLVTEAETWLGADRRNHDVTTAAYVVHAKIEYEFTLYRCRRGRDRGEWESEDNWTGSLEGDFDEDVAHLQGSQDHVYEVQSTATQLADFVIRAGGPSS